jgi:hypothetical protein
VAIRVATTPLFIGLTEVILSFGRIGIIFTQFTPPIGRLFDVFGTFTPGLWIHVGSLHLESHASGASLLAGTCLCEPAPQRSSQCGNALLFPFRPAAVRLSFAEIQAALPQTAVETAVVRGGFPELYANPDIDSGAFYNSYLATYLERDVRSLTNVGRPTFFGTPPYI